MLHRGRGLTQAGCEAPAHPTFTVVPFMRHGFPSALTLHGQRLAEGQVSYLKAESCEFDEVNIVVFIHIQVLEHVLGLLSTHVTEGNKQKLSLSDYDGESLSVGDATNAVYEICR